MLYKTVMVWEYERNVVMFWLYGRLLLARVAQDDETLHYHWLVRQRLVQNHMLTPILHNCQPYSLVFFGCKIFPIGFTLTAINVMDRNTTTSVHSNTGDWRGFRDIQVNIKVGKCSWLIGLPIVKRRAVATPKQQSKLWTTRQMKCWVSSRQLLLRSILSITLILSLPVTVWKFVSPPVRYLVGDCSCCLHEIYDLIFVTYDKDWGKFEGIP